MSFTYNSVSQQLYATLNSLFMEWKDFCTEVTQPFFFFVYASAKIT